MKFLVMTDVGYGAAGNFSFLLCIFPFLYLPAVNMIEDSSKIT